MAETPSGCDMRAPNWDRRRGGETQFGFDMQVDAAEMLTAGREAAYRLPTMKGISLCIEPGGMRAAFSHYETLLEDGKQNRLTLRSKLPMPTLVLNRSTE